MYKEIISTQMLNEDGQIYGRAIALVPDKKGSITEAQKNELQSPGYTDLHMRYHKRGLWDQVFCSVYNAESEARKDFLERGFICK